MNLSSLGNDCGVSHDTARRWLSVLEASFVTFRLQPYYQSFNKRLTRRPKLYFVDTGLLCWLLRIRDADQLATHAARGAVFENLVIAETLKAACNAGQVPDLYFWRDQRGHEIDLLVETPDGPHAVEIKSGETVAGGLLQGPRPLALAGGAVRTGHRRLRRARELRPGRRRRPRLARLGVSDFAVDATLTREPQENSVDRQRKGAPHLRWRHGDTTDRPPASMARDGRADSRPRRRPGCRDSP